MTAPMKLSDAILKGCEIIPEQAFGAYYRDAEGRGLTIHEGSVAISACALGAANLGGYPVSYPLLIDNPHSELCPECGAELASIVHLNDDHRWSRERIAEWLKEQGL